MTWPVPRAHHRVTGHGGVDLSVVEYGNPDGPPVLLLHGFAQCHLSWARQTTGPLAEGFRLIAPDMRGHGMSDKPAPSPATYTCSEPYADDIAAILDALSLDRTVLVGWSMGGIWANDYLRVCGPDRIAGLALVGSFSATGKHSPADALAARQADPVVMSKGLLSPDLATNMAATEAFIAACFATPANPADLAWTLAFNMLCPWDIRAAVRPREEDYRDTLGALDLPSLVLHGDLDRIVPKGYGAQSAAALRNAQHIQYQHSGHAPFWEEPDRFNADLARFSKRCFGGDA